MKIIVNRDVSVTTDNDGNIYVTRPDMYGKINTHRIATKEYSSLKIGEWLSGREGMVQDVFPNMSADDREFLLTGITPGEWAKIFPKGDR